MKTTLTVKEQDALGKKIYDKHPVNKEIYDEKYTKFAYQAGAIDGYIHAVEEIKPVGFSLKEISDAWEKLYGEKLRTEYSGFYNHLKRKEQQK